MRGVSRLLPGLILLLATPAVAQDVRYASEPQELVFEDVYDVFSVIQFDTGELPSPGDPITVRFHVTPTGGVVSGMEGESHLEWPGLEHQVVPVPGSGFLAVDSEIEIAAEVGIDIFGLWSGTVDLWNEYVVLYEATDFDPSLLGGEAGVLLQGDGLVDPLEFDITVFTGLDVVVGVEVYPSLGANLSGLRFETHNDEGTGIQTSEGEWAPLPVPTVATGSMPLDVDYISELDSSLALVVEPSVSLDTLIGGFQLLAFPIDIPLVDLTGERPFPTVQVEHPLPVIGPTPPSLDAGALDIGDLANVPVTVQNFGDMDLEGTARIVGSDDFSVFPEQIYLPPGGTDGLMVSFQPVLEGQRAVTLEIATNDPIVPVVYIEITGEGLAPELPDDSDRVPPDADGRVNGEEVKGGCGCDQGSAGGFVAWALPLALLGVRRRSRPVR